MDSQKVSGGRRRGAAEVGEWVGGAPGAGCAVGARGWRSQAGLRRRRARLPAPHPPSFPCESKASPARLRGPRPVTQAGLWPWALAPEGKKGAVPISHFLQQSRPAFDSRASPHASAGLSFLSRNRGAWGLPADAEADAPSSTQPSFLAQYTRL